MSWKASAWAKEQRLGSPAAKSILQCLADYADADSAECWPSQPKLAEDAEVSERTVREWLQRLEEWGLIGRERRSRANGARAADLIMLRLDARVTDGAERLREGRGADAGDGLPAESAGRTNRQSDAEPTGNQAQPTGNQFRAYKEEPSIEPPSGTSQPARQGAREGGETVLEEESPKAIETAFWRVVQGWPRFAGMPKEPARRAWFKLTAEERRLAEARLPGWFALLKAQRRDHVPAPATYFGERLWQDVPDPQEASAGPREAKPFGKMWMAMRLARLMTQEPGWLPKPPAFIASMIAEGGEKGERARLAHQANNGWPAVKIMDQLAADRRSEIIQPDMAHLEPLAASFEPVRVGGELWDAWRAQHERRGWRWIPDPGRQEWVYFPAGGPDGLAAFEAAVRGENDAGRREAAE